MVRRLIGALVLIEVAKGAAREFERRRQAHAALAAARVIVESHFAMARNLYGHECSPADPGSSS